MGKIYAAARVLALLVAIGSAFATVPSAAAILLFLGAISGVGNTAEDNSRVFLIATVLLVGSSTLTAVPGFGEQLKTIFTGIGTAAFGSSVIGFILGFYRRTLADFTGQGA